MQSNGKLKRYLNGHNLMMLACCVIAVGAVIYYFFGGNRGSGSPGLILMLLLCPLMHFFMMGSHGHKHDKTECTDHDQEKDSAEKK